MIQRYKEMTAKLNDFIQWSEYIHIETEIMIWVRENREYKEQQEAAIKLSIVMRAALQDWIQTSSILSGR